MAIIQCPNCDKKLKINDIPEGKKVRCPACKEPFMPSAAAPAAAKSAAPPAKKAAAAKPAAKKATAKAQPKAKPKPKRKPAAAAEDYVDFGDDEMYDDGGFDDDGYDDGGFDDGYDEAPRRSKAAAGGGGKKGGKGAAKKGKGKAQSGGKSKAPLFIGLGVLAVALAGGGAFFMMQGGDDDGTVAADADTGMGTDTADQMSLALDDGTAGNADAAAGLNTGSGHDAEGGQADGGVADTSVPATTASTDTSSVTAQGGTPVAASFGAPAMDASAGGASAGSSSSPSPPVQLPPVSGSLPPLGTQDSVVSTQWLPASSEAVVQIDVAKLLAGPVGQIMQNPVLAPKLKEAQDKFGFAPKDISSITFGVGGITDAVKSGRPPSGPDAIPVTVVIRATRNVEASELVSLIPNAEMATEGSVSFVRIPEDPPAAIWFPDSTTAVAGAESVVLQVATNSAPPTGLDTALLDGSSTIQLAFSPSDPDAIFRHPNAKLPPQVQPQRQATPKAFEMIDSFLENARGAGIGINFTNDLGVTMAVRAMDAAGAQKYAVAAQAAQVESKAQAAQQGQQMPPMMAPFMALNQKLSDSFKLETASDLSRSSMSAEGGGQQIAAFAPFVLPMVVQSLDAAQKSAVRAAGRVKTRNNYKEIALAMHNFHDWYKRFPNAASLDPSGNKMLSWRVHLLPFLNHEDLYSKFKLDEPWDSPANRPLADQMPDVYRSKNASVAPGKTLIQVPIGPGTMFEGGTGRAIRDCTDGTSNTVLYVETSPDRAVYWTQPDDLAFDAANPTAGLIGSAAPGFQAALADGSVRTVPGTVSPDIVKALMTRNGGEPVPADF